MKIMIDTNILVDYLQEREEEIECVNEIFHLCELRFIEGYISSLSICDATYILRKRMDAPQINKSINELNAVFNIVDLLGYDLVATTKLKYHEFEDAVLYTQAKRINADYFITQNLKDFKDYDIKAVSPSSFIKIIESDA